MTQKQKNPYRCETCNHWRKRHPTSTILTCELLNAAELGIIPIGEEQVMSVVGCASHSNMVSEEYVLNFPSREKAKEMMRDHDVAIRAEERERGFNQIISEIVEIKENVANIEEKYSEVDEFELEDIFDEIRTDLEGRLILYDEKIKSLRIMEKSDKE